MAAEPIPELHFYTPEGYLALEREAETKSEYLDGSILAMTGCSPNHAAITANIAATLLSPLKGKPYRAFSSALKISTPSDSLIAYPDPSVVCGEPRTEEDRPDVVTNPLLIVEVLSPSSEACDRGKKFRKYREIESLRDYLLVSQEEPFVDHYHKREDGVRTVIAAYGMDGSLRSPRPMSHFNFRKCTTRSRFRSRSSKKLEWGTSTPRRIQKRVPDKIARIGSQGRSIRFHCQGPSETIRLTPGR
jgi:Uma2 family endonuclease